MSIWSKCADDYARRAFLVFLHICKPQDLFIAHYTLVQVAQKYHAHRVKSSIKPCLKLVDVFFATHAFLQNTFSALESEIMSYFSREIFFLFAPQARFQVLPKAQAFFDQVDQEFDAHETRSVTRIA